MTARLCSECVNCEACENPAFCLDDTQRPCPHDRALCDTCTTNECVDCRLEAETDLYHTGTYDPAKDPFFRVGVKDNRPDVGTRYSGSPIPKEQ